VPSKNGQLTDNGHRFKPGNPGGPGRPKGSLTKLLREAGERGDYERGRELAEKVWQRALHGELTCIKLLYDRVDGPPVQQVEHQGEIRVTVTYV